VIRRKTSFNTTALKAVVLAMAIGVAGSALAQSTDGGIAGEATAGETIIVRGDNGVQRELHIDKTGKFSVRHLPIGTYDVLRLNDKGEVVNSQTTSVSVGKTSRVQ
jgi:hypothetical protein